MRVKYPALFFSCVLFAVSQCARSPVDSEPENELTVPVAPVINDSTVVVDGMHDWYLERTAVSPGWSAIGCTLTGQGVPDETVVWIGGMYCGTFSATGASVVISLDLDSLPLDLGEYTVIAASPGNAIGYFSWTVQYSAPYCITVTNDWDIPSFEVQFDAGLDSGIALHMRHPSLVMTHFAGPYAFTDPAISDGRKQILANWLNRMETDFGDETGMHIHPYCHLLAPAGVACLSDSFGTPAGVPEGYAGFIAWYQQDEFRDILRCADSVFDAVGLPPAVSFRAGGWTVTDPMLDELAQAGYRVDASGCNVTRGDAFADSPLGVWLARQWSGITDTSQPYRTAFPEILEAPDNGLLADYVDSTEMVGIFRANWAGGVLTSPRHCSVGYHPDTFRNTYGRLDGALSYFDRFLAADGAGPVVYVLMRDLPYLW